MQSWVYKAVRQGEEAGRTALHFNRNYPLPECRGKNPYNGKGRPCKKQERPPDISCKFPKVKGKLASTVKCEIHSSV